MTEDARFVEVLAPGLLTSVQDPSGRTGYQQYGVSVGGCLDRPSALAANALVGNEPEAALLEVTVLGPTLRFLATATFAITGADLSCRLDGQRVALGQAVCTEPGQVLAFGPRRGGARAYLAFSGGIDVEPVLGSRSTDLRSGFGGFEGRALRAGDRLPLGEPRPPTSTEWEPGQLLNPNVPLRVLPGPHVDRFEAGTLEALTGGVWKVGLSSDRMGYRLEGAGLRHVRGADVPSLGLPEGAIQVPGDGQPIVLMADRQPTGGYAVLACVITADLPLLAQRTPGQTVWFRETTLEVARAALWSPMKGR